MVCEVKVVAKILPVYSPLNIKGRTTNNSVGKQSQAGLSLLDDIDSSARGFCAVLSGDMFLHERSLSFTYGRPVESLSSLGQMYFGKQRETE